MVKISSISQRVNLKDTKSAFKSTNNNQGAYAVSFEGNNKPSRFSPRALMAIATIAAAPVVVPTTANASEIDDLIAHNVNTAVNSKYVTTFDKYTQDANNFFYVTKSSLPLVDNGITYQNYTMIMGKELKNGKEMYILNLYPETSEAQAVQTFLAGNNGFSVAGKSIQLVDKNGKPVILDLSKIGNIITEVKLKPTTENFANLFNKKGEGSTTGALNYIDGTLPRGTTTDVQGGYSHLKRNNLSSIGTETTVENVSDLGRRFTAVTNFAASKESVKLSPAVSETIISETPPANYTQFNYTSYNGTDMKDLSQATKSTVTIPGGSTKIVSTTGDKYHRVAADLNATIIPKESYKNGKFSFAPYGTFGVRGERFNYSDFPSDTRGEFNLGTGIASQYKNGNFVADATAEGRLVKGFGDGTSSGAEGSLVARFREFLTKHTGIEASGLGYTIKGESGGIGKAGIFYAGDRLSVGTGIAQDAIKLSGGGKYNATQGYVDLKYLVGKMTAQIKLATNGAKDTLVQAALSRKW